MPEEEGNTYLMPRKGRKTRDPIQRLLSRLGRGLDKAKESARGVSRDRDCPTLTELTRQVDDADFSAKARVHGEFCPDCSARVKLIRNEMAGGEDPRTPGDFEQRMASEIERVPFSAIQKEIHTPDVFRDVNALMDEVVLAHEGGMARAVLLERGAPKHRLLAGERYYCVAQLALLPEIAAVVVPKGKSERKMTNLQYYMATHSLNPREEAALCEMLFSEYGMKTKEVSRAVGRTARYVKALMDILRSSSELQRLVAEGFVPITSDGIISEYELTLRWRSPWWKLRHWRLERVHRTPESGSFRLHRLRDRALETRRARLQAEGLLRHPGQREQEGGAKTQTGQDEAAESKHRGHKDE